MQIKYTSDGDDTKGWENTLLYWGYETWQKQTSSTQIPRAIAYVNCMWNKNKKKINNQPRLTLAQSISAILCRHVAVHMLVSCMKKGFGFYYIFHAKLILFITITGYCNLAERLEILTFLKYLVYIYIHTQMGVCLCMHVCVWLKGISVQLVF